MRVELRATVHCCMRAHFADCSKEIFGMSFAALSFNYKKIIYKLGINFYFSNLSFFERPTICLKKKEVLFFGTLTKKKHKCTYVSFFEWLLPTSWSGAMYSHAIRLFSVIIPSSCQLALSTKRWERKSKLRQTPFSILEQRKGNPKKKSNICFANFMHSCRNRHANGYIIIFQIGTITCFIVAARKKKL